jgi:large subunit ribosomal protein L9
VIIEKIKLERIMVKVFLLKDVEKIGMAGEVVNVSDGFAANYLVPRKLGIEVTATNQKSFEHQKKTVEHRKEVISTKTSMLAERIKSLKVVFKRKLHDGDKLYGSISAGEVADMLAEQGVSVVKNQIEFDKAIKAKGTYEVTVKLSSTLQPKITVVVVPE